MVDMKDLHKQNKTPGPYFSTNVCSNAKVGCSGDWGSWGVLVSLYRARDDVLLLGDLVAELSSAWTAAEAGKIGEKQANPKYPFT